MQCDFFSAIKKKGPPQPKAAEKPAAETVQSKQSAERKRKRPKQTPPLEGLVPDYPFATEYGDHFETSQEALNDLVCIIILK